MTCPEPTISLFFEQWLFDGFQVVGIVLVWEVVRFLWRVMPMRRLLTRLKGKE